MENGELTTEELDQIMAGYPDQLVQLYSLLDNSAFANDKEKLERIK